MTRGAPGGQIHGWVSTPGAVWSLAPCSLKGCDRARAGADMPCLKALCPRRHPAFFSFLPSAHGWCLLLGIGPTSLIKSSHVVADPDPHLETDSKVWPQTCPITAEFPQVLGSWLELAAIPGPVLLTWLRCCGIRSWMPPSLGERPCLAAPAAPQGLEASCGGLSSLLSSMPTTQLFISPKVGLVEVPASTRPAPSAQQHLFPIPHIYWG